MNYNSHKSWHVHSKENKNKLEKTNQENELVGAKERLKKRRRDSEREKEETQRLLEEGFQRRRLADPNDDPQQIRPVDFVYQQPPGMVKEEEEKPEDCIPDKPENEKARAFLSTAPTKGLWMPLGKEVKVMPCWRCKAYGHRTGDRECPLVLSGNPSIESERQLREDPMTAYLADQKQQTRQLAEERIRELYKALLDSEPKKKQKHHHKRKEKDRTKEKHKKKNKEKHKEKTKSKEKNKDKQKDKERENDEEKKTREKRRDRASETDS